MVKLLSMIIVLLVITGCARMSLSYTEYSSTGKKVKVFSYSSTKNITAKGEYNPQTGLISFDIVSEAAAVNKSMSDQYKQVIDAASSAAGQAANIAIKGATK